LEREIDSVSKQLKELELLLVDNSLYDEADNNRLTDLLLQQRELKAQLASKEEIWMQLQEQLE
ncbi:MAG: hypothetical protein RL120_01365, partial [Gammaproteobacteria bacterium]